MTEPTQSSIFHIHIDATHLPKELEVFSVAELGFVDTDFSGHPEGYRHFEPFRHLTLKLSTKQDFNEVWERLREKADGHEDFVGYLEGEYVPEDLFLPYKPFTDAPVPFEIKRRLLDGSEQEKFRQTELHLTFDKDKSERFLVDQLLNSGLYGAYVEKNNGTYLVLTAQGFVRDLNPLYECLKRYLDSCGGLVGCTLKEERAVKFKLYGIDERSLPEVVDSVVYLAP